ncbi:squalene/phytoene synthase family protein [Phycisphaera mikurensis]|uniref:Putative phytoene synthase n=1 Tax=Phycisphaera mikurensis (strain NBRC 102666 / KCTC 22515 / FYK2301M01) TaxID=1142394 RepID=I0IFU7_PHYMF|nr:squalene/phytoene synthase family protein [Phycisphaera mikurensis]MBB6440476.1 squalene synthase HpnC [Phycisphaera mikurensis]BAM04135.1 putative phytoene synthase [Phycisphaera mikurensis NBRC 102666]
MPDAPTAQTDARTRGRRENFPVLSWLVPRRLQPAYAAVYRFCRAADDAADRPGDPAENLQRLAELRAGVASLYGGLPGRAADRAVFGPLGAAVRGFGLPRAAFDDLLDAFEQDQRQSHYATWEDLLGYCRRSADPVGRLVLKIHGVEDAERLALSDATCTALQLTNNLQDLRPDLLTLGRSYLPEDVANRHGLDPRALAAAIRRDAGSDAAACRACPPVAGAELRALAAPLAATVADLAARARALFEAGSALPARLPPRAARPVAAFGLAGAAVLRRVAEAGPGLARRRPPPPRGALAVALLKARFTPHGKGSP